MEYTANISSARNTFSTQEGWDDINSNSDSDDNNNNNVDDRQISDVLPKEVVKILVNTQGRDKVQAVVHNEDPEPPIIPPHDGNGVEESGNTKRQRAAPQLTAPVLDQLAAAMGPQVVPPFQAAVS